MLCNVTHLFSSWRTIKGRKTSSMCSVSSVPGPQNQAQLWVASVTSAPAYTLQALGTALGYFGMLSCLVAHYMDGPLLYMLGSCSSTSVLWHPRSFWDPMPASPLQILRLHVQSTPACLPTLFPE